MIIDFGDRNSELLTKATAIDVITENIDTNCIRSYCTHKGLTGKQAVAVEMLVGWIRRRAFNERSVGNG